MLAIVRMHTNSNGSSKPALYQQILSNGMIMKFSMSLWLMFRCQIVICPSTAEGFKCQLSQSRYKVGVMPSIYFIVWNSTKILANASNDVMLPLRIVPVPIFRICCCIVKMKETSCHHQLLVPNFHRMLLVSASHILYIPTCSTARFHSFLVVHVDIPVDQWFQCL